MLEAKPRATSSTGAITWTEDEVSKKERHIGDLTTQVRSMRRVVKENAEEYTRNRGAMANKGAKYAELREARELLKAARGQEREPRGGAFGGARRSPAGLFGAPLIEIRWDANRRGAPCCRYLKESSSTFRWHPHHTQPHLFQNANPPPPPPHTHTHTRTATTPCTSAPMC